MGCGIRFENSLYFDEIVSKFLKFHLNMYFQCDMIITVYSTHRGTRTRGRITQLAQQFPTVGSLVKN